jgi:hypothetical protein
VANKRNETHAVETHVDAKRSLGIDPGPLQELNSLTNQVLTTQKLTVVKTHKMTISTYPVSTSVSRDLPCEHHHGNLRPPPVNPPEAVDITRSCSGLLLHLGRVDHHGHRLFHLQLRVVFGVGETGDGTFSVLVTALTD